MRKSRDKTSTSLIVSVVVPTYNLAYLVAHTLRSLAEQTLLEIEVIILDDGSNDDLQEAVSSFLNADRRFKYVRQENKGLPAARNAGYRACNSESRYVMFLDADDVLMPDALETMARHLDDHPEAGMVHCMPEFIDAQGGILENLAEGWPRGWAYGPRKLTLEDTVTPLEAIYTLTAGIICSLSLLRRSTYELAGGFDEDFGHHREDTDLFIRIALLSGCHCIPVRLTCYRRYDGQMSSDLEGLQRQREHLYSKWRKWSDSKADPESRNQLKEAERFRISAHLQISIATDYLQSELQAGRCLSGIRVWLGAWRRHGVNLLREGLIG